MLTNPDGSAAIQSAAIQQQLSISWPRAIPAVVSAALSAVLPRVNPAMRAEMSETGGSWVA